MILLSTQKLDFTSYTDPTVVRPKDSRRIFQSKK